MVNRLIDLIETYAYGASNNLENKKAEINCKSITKNTTIIKNIKELNLNWPRIPDPRYRI